MNTRNSSVDLAKTAAIIGVLVIHSAGNCLYAPVASRQFAIGVFMESIVRGSVPLFFMCSGVLFLDKNRDVSVKKLYTRSIPRLLAAMLLWGMVYHLAEPGFSFTALWQTVKNVLLFRQSFHLYFIHILLLVYAFVPVTRAFLKGADCKTVGYCLLLWFLLGIVYPTVSIFPPFSRLSGIPLQWKINMAYGAIGYGVLGIALWKRKIRGDVSILLFISGILFTFLSTLLYSRRCGHFASVFWEGMSIGPCLMAMGMFGLCCRVKLSSLWSNLCRRISEASFCIYLVHILILRLVQKGMGVNYPPIMIPVVAALTFAGSMAVYAVLSKLPFVKKWFI